MKLFSFPQAMLEKAIARRLLTLEPPQRAWFTERWQQKPYKKAFIERKAMPLVTLVAKGKTWDEATFDETLQAWDVQFHEAEAAVLRPLVEGDGLLQLMQKNLPPERASKLLERLAQRPAGAPRNS
ncbi:hypothetical protein [Comamonas sp. NLF-1-9]|uniref:hypothetical protein n=1 Tax=Comamonas sp. NLF-1-9 TaxID=2853163 RepID=UPI001C45F940|nr:hypothetical protein [Comamonas sp. NLF-1-9]QXL84839.1 hypothetical protein KUD94_02265 [Comamonas sp. NLF-1-9]